MVRIGLAKAKRGRVALGRKKSLGSEKRKEFFFGVSPRHAGSAQYSQTVPSFHCPQGTSSFSFAVWVAIRRVPHILPYGPPLCPSQGSAQLSEVPFH